MNQDGDVDLRRDTLDEPNEKVLLILSVEASNNIQRRQVLMAHHEQQDIALHLAEYMFVQLGCSRIEIVKVLTKCAIPKSTLYQKMREMDLEQRRAAHVARPRLLTAEEQSQLTESFAQRHQSVWMEMELRESVHALALRQMHQASTDLSERERSLMDKVSALTRERDALRAELNSVKSKIDIEREQEG